MEIYRDKGTESKIFFAAKELFLRKGFDGVRMEEIASLACVNKACLHYYFRSKERLFESVFLYVTDITIKSIVQILEDIKESKQVDDAVSVFIDFLDERPGFPLFIINAINFKPELIHKLSSQLDNNIGCLDISNYYSNGALSGKHLLLHLLSLCTFPTIYCSIIAEVGFKSDGKSYEYFLNNRKKEIATLLRFLISIDRKSTL